MKGFLSVRRLILFVALALLGADAATSVARAGDFRAGGSYAVSQHGSDLEGTRVGRAQPGGPFLGAFSGRWVAHNRGTGVGLLDFGRGDTLSYQWQVEFDDATGLLLGTWVVTGGTGKLAGATGSGTSVATANGDGTGEFEYVGDLSY